MKNNSNQMIKDFNASQLKRMRRLIIFLIIALLLNLSGLLWLRATQNRANQKLGDTFNTLQGYVQGESKRNSDRDATLADQHDKLFKAISCLLILHDSHAITDPALDETECKKVAQEVGSMNPPPSPSPKTTSQNSTSPQNTNSTTSSSNQQPNSGGGGTPSQPQPNMVQRVINDLEGLGRSLGGVLGL